MGTLKSKYDAVILAVGHLEFKALDFESLKKEKKSVIYDIKGILAANVSDGRL